MKRFLKDIFLIIALVLVSCAGFFLVQYLVGRGKSGSYGPELYYALNLAEETQEYTSVIIGDSVARLIFDPDYQEETTSTCYLATNQAITVLGNYILLSRYLENNPQTEEVTYILRPQSLANPLWYNFSYQYFILPFYNDTYKGYIDAETCAYIEDRFGRLYTVNELVKSFIENNAYYMDVYLNNILEQQLEVRDEKHISDLSVRYLRAIADLCEEYGCCLHILCAPLPDTQENHDWSEMEAQFTQYGLADLLGSYFDGLDYYPEDCFVDEAHFTEDYLAENRAAIIEALLDGE